MKKLNWVRNINKKVAVKELGPDRIVIFEVDADTDIWEQKKIPISDILVDLINT